MISRLLRLRTFSAPRSFSAWLTRMRLGFLLRSSLFVQLSADRLKARLEFFGCALNRRHIVSIQLLTHILDGVFDILLLVSGQLFTKLLQLFLALVGQVIRVIPNFGCFARFSVLFRVRFSFLAMPFHFFLRQSARTGNRYLLFFAGSQILC